MELMTITQYCKSRGISRTTFYRYRQAGIFKGCFVLQGKKKWLDAEKADAAIAFDPDVDLASLAEKIDLAFLAEKIDLASLAEKIVIDFDVFD